MQLSSSFSIIVSAALMAFTTTATALPLPLPNPLPLPQVQVFTDGGFAGASADLPLSDPNGPNEGCQTLGDGWERSISSLKLRPGLGCTFYATGDCTPGAGAWEFNGGEHPTIPAEANDRFSSYSCLQGLEVVVTKG